MNSDMAGINGKKGIFIPIGDERMADKPLAFRVPQDVFDCLSKLPNKSEWARNLIVSTVRRELMSNAPQPGLDVAVTNYGESLAGPGDDVPNLGAISGPGEKPKRVRKPKGES